LVGRTAGGSAMLKGSDIRSVVDRHAITAAIAWTSYP